MAPVSFPAFSSLDIALFVPRLETLLQANLQTIEVLLKQKPPLTWENLMLPLEDMGDALEKLWSPLAHLHAVQNSPVLRECYQACLPKLSAYEAAIGQHHALFEAISALDRTVLNSVQLKIVDDMLLHFKLAGVALSTVKKQRFEAISARLSVLSNQFENNVLDASQAYELHLSDEHRLSGLPAHAMDEARALGQEKHGGGFVLNLEFPCYVAVISYADDRSLRETLYKAYVTRASEQGVATYDNTPVMNELLALRHEMAELLAYPNYAALSLATKMAVSEADVLSFLNDLCQRSHEQALQDVEQLKRFAKETYAMDHLEPWDIPYLSEKQKHAQFSITDETLRPYFPLAKVMDGLFEILKRLYGMVMEPVELDTWHKDVICYRIKDSQEQVRGYIYADFFARKNKRSGAWMDSLQSRRKLAQGELQLPMATLTCNFAKPAAKQAPCLSHDEVLTLFHEMGHCLHHVLTQVDYLDASGIHGVEWDAVELPSQFFENFCWEAEALSLLTAHIDSGEVLPDSLFGKMMAAKNFQSAMAMMRQLEFSLFDFRLHMEEPKHDPAWIAAILQTVRKQTQILPLAPYNRFQHSFSHIFAGGYSAGYYSYKWAEVLSSDAFARFEEEGIFNSKTGHAFLHEILEVGGSRKAADSFIQFRGRAAKIDALLRHNGIQANGQHSA